jgi:hypothetical protein
MTGISLNYVKAIHGDEEDEAGMYVCHYQRRPLCRVLGALPSAEAKRRFAECHTRQMPSLPSVEHSTKRDTRQTSSLPSVHSTKNNPRQKKSSDAIVLAITLCRVLAVSTRQRCSLCRVSILALSEDVSLPSAKAGTRQINFFCLQIFSMGFIDYIEAHV